MAKSSFKKKLFKLGIKLEFLLKRSTPFVYRSPGKKRMFFPGCALVSSGPEVSLKTWEYLLEKDSNMGLWFDCCGMPLSKFVDKNAASGTHRDLASTIKEEGIEEIITSCGNCTLEFNRFKEEVPGLKITSLYDILADDQLPQLKSKEEYFVHHPCSARTDKEQQVSFQNLTENLGLKIIQPDEKKYPLACCVSQTDSAKKRIDKVKDKKMLSYCGHCTRVFQKDIESTHVLETIFPVDQKMEETSKLNRFFRYFSFIHRSKAIEGNIQFQKRPTTESSVPASHSAAKA